MSHNKRLFWTIFFATIIPILLFSQKVASANLDNSTPTITPTPNARNQNPLPTSHPRTAPIIEPSNHTPFSQKVATEGEPPSISPTRIAVTLDPGETHNEEVQVFTGDIPFGKGDVMFVFDRTGSMGGEIGQAKISAIDIMNAVREELPNTWFGVASFMDYPGYFSYPGYADQYGASESGDVPWELNIGPTDSITDVSNAINNLWIGWGADWPEDYTRVLYEVSQITPVGWRDKAKRIVVLFGDAPTHDLDFAGYNFGGDPGLDAIAQTDDDLDFETVVQQVASEDISVIAVDSGYSPESEATFKGMSVGYAAASGTNGAYFNLTDTSDIPEVTVDLIIAETQVIDSLSLKTTEGFENWVKVEPPEIPDVGSQATVTFDVSITVPSGTSPGFYPFLIEAVGDGANLDIIYVEVTVPSGSPISDLGFKPNLDGFKFDNIGKDNKKWWTTLTWGMFEQFFGTSQVEYPNGNRIHAADVFFKDLYRKASGDPDNPEDNGGMCDGFSATSLLNFKGLDQPNAGEFGLPKYSPLYSQNINTDIRDAIAFSQGIQLGVEVGYHRILTCELLGSSKSYFDYLKSQIQNNSPVVLGIRWTKDYYAYFPSQKVLEKGGGHALVPYKFEEPSDDTAYVYVYDSNIPGNDKHRVEFDFKNNKWKYDWHVPLWPDITIEENVKNESGNNCTLNVTPLEMYRHQGVALWTFTGQSLNGTSLLEDTPYQLFSTSGPAKLLFTDDEGRRLGWDGLNFYDEIPGASYFPVYTGSGQTPSGLYYIPGNLLYDLRMYGDGEGRVNVGLWSEGYMVQLSNLEVTTGTVIDLSIPSDGSSITVSGVTAETQGSLSINQMLSDQDRAVSFDGLNLSPGEELTFHYLISDESGELETIKLSTNSSESRTYNLSLQRAGGEGYSVFGHGGLFLDANSDSFVEVNNWSDIDEVTISVDHNKDGVVDETRVADNQTTADTISFEAARSIIYTGGESVNIIVSVKDQFGAYVADGALVQLSTNLGTLSINEGITTGGLIDFVLTSGSDAGTATIRAKINGIESSLEIAIINHEVYLPSIERSP